MPSGARPAPTPPCHHNSTRGDGWLDDHCLLCGKDGYWEGGNQVAYVEIHPSGKVLVRLDQETADDTADEDA